MYTFDELRKAYPEFIYHKYTVKETDSQFLVKYHFEIKGLAEFTPEWTFQKGEKIMLDYENNKTLKTMVYSLGLVELISYWKITCSPKVIIEAGSVDENQKLWWKTQYYHGLGEFFYTNDIKTDFGSFMEIVSAGKDISGIESPLNDNKGCLIPVGGGKDSAVTIEILSGDRENNCCYIINPRKATIDTAEIGAFNSGSIISVKRTLDKNMLALNKEGYLNGHTPFSAIVAFSALISAYLNNLKYITLSNESSANESTVLNSTVNHQYSKSFKFEQDFDCYEKTYINSGISYFSLLRPLSEFQIAWYFAKQKKYHKYFRSCNAGSKQDIWCCNCPKCLFVFLILSPFLEHSYLCEIFGEDLTEKENLLGTFKQLIGVTEEKPFECVGSRDEVNTAICIAIKNMEEMQEKLPLHFRYYKNTELYQTYKNKIHEYDNYYDENNLLPEKYDKIMRNIFLNKKF